MACTDEKEVIMIHDTVSAKVGLVELLSVSLMYNALFPIYQMNSLNLSSAEGGSPRRHSW